MKVVYMGPANRFAINLGGKSLEFAVGQAVEVDDKHAAELTKRSDFEVASAKTVAAPAPAPAKKATDE